MHISFIVQLEDIIKDDGIVYSGDLNMNSVAGSQFEENAQRRPQSPNAPNKGDNV